MHSRMRHRVAEFQKILNRAKAEVATTERKTVRLVHLLALLTDANRLQWADSDQSLM